MNTPSAEALALAVKLSGHDGTQCKYGARICEGCIADARTIDRELALPAKNAALLLAQALIDEADSYAEDKKRHAYLISLQIIDELREALSRIK